MSSICHAAAIASTLAVSAIRTSRPSALATEKRPRIEGGRRITYTRMQLGGIGKEGVVHRVFGGNALGRIEGEAFAQ